MKHKIYIENDLLRIDDRIYPSLSAMLQIQVVDNVEFISIQNINNSQFYVFNCPISEIHNSENTPYSDSAELQGTLKQFLANMPTISQNGNAAKIDSDGQLHIVAGGILAGTNSTEIPLPENGFFLGETIDILKYAVITIAVYADKTSAADGLKVEFSKDGINFFWNDTFTIAADTGKTFSFQPVAQYMRVSYLNGAEAQTFFQLSTILKKSYSKPSSHRINDSISNQDDAELIKSVLTGYDVSTGMFINVGAKIGELGYNMLASLDQTEKTTNSLKIIDYAHAELHGGDMFVVRTFINLIKAQTKYILIETPDTARWAHTVIGVAPISSSITASIYEAATISTLGTLVTAFNRNRNSIKLSTINIYINPTVTVEGTKLQEAIVGTDRNVGGQIRDNEEILLKQNTLYLIKLTEQNIVATDVNISIDWYEHTNIE